MVVVDILSKNLYRTSWYTIQLRYTIHQNPYILILSSWYNLSISFSGSCGDTPPFLVHPIHNICMGLLGTSYFQGCKSYKTSHPIYDNDHPTQPNMSASPLSTVITRADLAKLSIAQPEDKDKTAARMVQSLKRDVLSYNSKGKTDAIMSIYDERPEIHNKVLEKMKEIFVDSHFEIQTTCAGYKNLAVNWAVPLASVACQGHIRNLDFAYTPVGWHSQPYRACSNPGLPGEARSSWSRFTEDEKTALVASDDEESDEEESDDDEESPIHLHIALSEPSTIYKAELICMIMVTSMTISAMGSWLMVLSYMK